MKIRQLIIALVLLLAYGDVWGQRYTLSKNSDNLRGNDRWEITFGTSFEEFAENFFSSSNGRIYDTRYGSYLQIDYSKYTFIYKGSDGVVKSFGYGCEDNNALFYQTISQGSFKYVLKYSNEEIDNFGNDATDWYISADNGNDIEFVVNPKEITITSTSKFHCTYNGTTTFTVDDFFYDERDGVDLETFKASCQADFASFDQSTEIDFERTTFEFNTKGANPDPKPYTVHWVLKSNSTSEDLSGNYVFSDGTGNGNIHPRTLKADVVVSDRFEDGTALVGVDQSVVNIDLEENGGYSSEVLSGDDVQASVDWNTVYRVLAYQSKEVGDWQINGFVRTESDGRTTVLVDLTGSDAANYQITDVVATSSIKEKPKCADGTWQSSATRDLDGDVITLYYGDKIGDGLGYELWANSINGETATLSYKKADASDYSTYTIGSTQLGVGEYEFLADYSNCITKPLSVVVNPYTVVPKPKFNSDKYYDNTKFVFGLDGEKFDDVEVPDFEIYAGDVLLKSNDFVFDDDDFLIFASASYDDANAGDQRTITADYKLEPAQDYYKVVTPALFDGAIKPIQPSVEWEYNGVPCADQTKVVLEYGESLDLLDALLPEDIDLTLASLYYDDRSYTYGIIAGTRNLNEFLPGVYRKIVVFPGDGVNLLSVTSSIDIYVGKVAMQLQRSGNTDDEIEYGAKVGIDLTYDVVNRFQESNIKYVYYMSSDLSLDEAGLFVDENIVSDGYTPMVGEYLFGCVATDANGYMYDGKEFGNVTIIKTGGAFKIDEPEIVLKKTYDGNYFAEVTTPAKFGDIEFETTAYYVDDRVSDASQVDDSYFRSDVGQYDIYYKVIIPDDLSAMYDFYLSDDDISIGQDGKLIYATYTSGSYRYHKPGNITCGKLELEVEFPNAEHAFVYGDDFILGGSRNQDVRVYTKLLNGDYVFNVDGEMTFADFSVNPYVPLAEPLSAGVYNNIQVQLDVQDGNYCGLFESDAFNFTVTPKPLTFDGDFVIDDKVYDGSDIIKSDGVVTKIKGGLIVNGQFPENQQIRSVPNIVGVLSGDVSSVYAEWDFSNTKYPSAEVKYTDETQSEVAAYTDIPASVSLSGSRASNYKLPDNTIVYGSSKIYPVVQIEFDENENVTKEDELVYRLQYGTSVLGVDFKVKDEIVGDGQYVRYIQDGRYDRTFLMQSPKVNSDDYYDFEAQVVEGNRDEDMYKDNVKIVASIKFKLYVDKLKLIVSEPDIEKVKLYDGNTSVKWVDDNNKSRLTNVVGDDDVNLENIDIQYDSPEVGGGKVITARYTVGGNHLYKYILPDDYVTDGAISSGDVVIVDVTPVTGTGQSGTVAPNNDGYCAGEDILLNVKITEGIPVGFSIIFDEASKAVGFEDVMNETVDDAGDGVYQLKIKCPNAAYGKYSGKLSLIDFTGKESAAYPFEVMVNYPSKYLRQKFNDVILVDNHFMADNDKHLFNESNPDVSYQWYVRENDVDTDISGETKQFYSTTTKGVYGAYALTSGGERIKICPIEFPIYDLAKSSTVSKSVTTYPNPARSMETVTIKLNNFDADSYRDVVIYIYNSVGSVVSTIKNVDVLNTVNLPSGNYSGVVVYEGNKISFKFIVRN